MHTQFKCTTPFHKDSGDGSRGGVAPHDGWRYAFGSTLEKLISDKKPQPSHHTERAMMRDDLNRILDKALTKRESDVLRLRFGLEDGKTRTLAEIGESMSVTRERIRQIETRALEKMRSPEASQVLKEYLECETMQMEF